MLYKSSLVSKVAVANSSEAMEAENQQHGASLKSHTSRRNFLVFFCVIVALVLSVAFTSCNKGDDKNDSGKLSPPEWIQGEWSAIGITYKFTSDDVIFHMSEGEGVLVGKDVSFKNYPSIKENLKTDDIYEFGYTGATYRFEKGDGNYIGQILNGASSIQFYKIK